MSESVVALRPVDGALVRFDPSETQERLAELEGDIVKWRLLKDWPKLEQAVDAKMTEQSGFIANWDITVRPRGRQPNVATGQLLSVEQAKDLWGFDKPAVSRWRSWLAEAPAYRARLILGTHRAAGLIADDNHRARGTGENEWFTPAQYIAAARSVMGAIDLDPASSDAAQETVRADRYFTIENDGLDQDWFGRVWLNPPYSQPAIFDFVKQLVTEYRAGRVRQAILLTHNYTDTEWFHTAALTAQMICFTRGRIHFLDADGGEANPTQGQAFFYYGDEVDEFRRHFAPYGFVVCPA